MTGLLLLLLAVVAGALLPVQAGVNARLAHFVGGAVRASLVSFIVGALCLAVIVALFHRSDAQRAAAAPWWAWAGGACGAFYVTATLVASVRIGAAAFFGILVAAQLAASVVFDQFGWIGFPQKEASPLRLLGVGLLVAGAVLVRLF
jgi:transporter family-2 protein